MHAAICACLAEKPDCEVGGLLKAIREPSIVFSVEFPSRLFISVNESSESLQSADTDMAAAVKSIAELNEDW